MCDLAPIIERRSETLADLPVARLEEDFARVQRAGEMIELERLQILAELERRRVHERDGHLSVASWLASTHRVSYGTARRSAATARALEHMPETRRALEAGEVSLAGVGMLVQARGADPHAFERSEALLVQGARMHSISGLSRVVGHWRQAVAAQAGADTEAELRARRRLHASATFAGMVRVDGDLDPETGEVLLTALGAVVDAECSLERGRRAIPRPATCRCPGRGLSSVAGPRTPSRRCGRATASHPHGLGGGPGGVGGQWGRSHRG